jgi:hypothetical protein
MQDRPQTTKPQHNTLIMKHTTCPFAKRSAGWRSLLPATATATLALCHFNGAAANLIQNGSFENPSVGSLGYDLYLTGETIGGAWLVESAAPDLLLVGSWGVPSIFHPTMAGSQFCYLADSLGSSVLRQDIATPLAAGYAYELTFLQSAFAQNWNSPGGEVTVELAPLGGASELAQVFSLSDYADWTERNLRFTPAVSAPYTLRFSSTRGMPGNIDDVQFSVVPEPSACGLAATLGLGFTMMRRLLRQ